LFGPADGDWGDISHASLWDSQTGGNAVYVGDLDVTKTILDQDKYELPAGEIVAEAN
jgi:hypothetical protein